MDSNPYEAPAAVERVAGATKPASLCYVPFCLAIACYCAALLMAGDLIAEILSDAGNAIMLSTAVLILIQLFARSERERRLSAPEN